MSNPYVSISAYERVTGTPVAKEQRSRVQHLLDTNVALVTRYLGASAEIIFAEHLDPLITDMVCRFAEIRMTIPYGVRAEAVGSSSVSYLDPQSGLLFADRLILDDLLGIISRGQRSVLVNLA